MKTETYKKELQVKIGKILDENLQLDMPRPVKAKMNVVRKIMELLPLESVPVSKLIEKYRELLEKKGQIISHLLKIILRNVSKITLRYWDSDYIKN